MKGKWMGAILGLLYGLIGFVDLVASGLAGGYNCPFYPNSLIDVLFYPQFALSCPFSNLVFGMAGMLLYFVIFSLLASTVGYLLGLVLSRKPKTSKSSFQFFIGFFSLLVFFLTAVIAYPDNGVGQNGLINFGDDCNLNMTETPEVIELCNSLLNGTYEPPPTPRYVEETAQREFILDAPFQTESSLSFPLLLGIRDSDGIGYAYSFYSVKLIDKNNNNQIAYTFSLNELGLSPAGSCFSSSYATINAHTWFKSLNVNLNNIPLVRDQNNEVAFTIEFDGSVCGSDGDAIPDNGDIFRVRLSQNIPKLQNWYCGDTHYHSSYTDTKFASSLQGEFGAPLESTSLVAGSIGLDWFTATDHSNSFSRHINDGLGLTWEDFKTDCNSNSRCLIGTELNCDYSFIGGGNHLLGYDYSNYIEDNFVDLFSPNNPTCSQMINNVHGQGGFSYAAHPESIFDPFGGIVNSWHNYSLGFYGLEIWNGNIRDPQEGQERIQELEAGLEKWKDILLGRNGLTARKVLVSAGSDAHGDFNEKFGREMTCVYAPFYSKQNILTGLRNGNSYMTNNGALIFSLNGAKLGETTTSPVNSQVTLNINYNVLNSCTLKVYKGIIGGTETQIGSSQTLSYSGSLTRTDTISSNSYYRLECLNGNNRIYTNPIWINVTQQTSCVIPTNNMNVNSNISFCPGQYFLPDGIKIVSDNVVLDCNGASISGSSNNHGIWIFQKSGVTVKNCKINNFIIGIYSFSNDTVSNKIFNNTLFGNHGGIATVRKHEVSFNEAYNNVVGIQSSVVSGNSLKILNNSIYNNSNGILIEDTGTEIQTNINWNEIHSNNPNFDLRNVARNNISAINNWWGTNNESAIAQSILDFNDDNTKGVVFFIPFTQVISSCSQSLVNITLLSWQNISCLPNNFMNQSQTILQYDLNSCGTTSNQTFYEYRQNVSCDFCQPNSTFTNWTAWQNQSSCLQGDYYIQNISRTEYDANYGSCYAVTNLSSDLWNNGLNITYWEFQNLTCDFCTPNLANTSWTPWSNIGVCTNNLQNQSRFRIQYDSNNCGEVQNQTIYEYNLTQCSNPQNNQTNNQSIMLIINEPMQNHFADKKVKFNITVNQEVDEISYIDWTNLREKVLCRDCDGYGDDRKRTLSFSDGIHNLSIQAVKNDVIADEENFWFLVDSKIPQISTISPRSNGFTNGSNFYIKYSEVNCQSLGLNINAQDSGGGGSSCQSGTNVEKFISSDLSSYNNQQIEYQFVIRDIVNNTKESRRTRVKVDTTPPLINSFNYSNNVRRITFVLNVTELNLDEVSYTDFADSNPRARTLCSSLRNGICTSSKTFSVGNHNLLINVLDKAGNSAQRNLAFNCNLLSCSFS